MVGSQWNTTRGKRGESENVCHLLGNFGKRFLTNGTGLENVSEKRNVLELYHLQNTITLLGNDRHFSPSASTGSLALELVNQSGTKNFGRFGQNGKKVIPERNYIFSGNFHRDEPFHLNSPWNYRVFHTNGKRSKTLSALPWSGYLSACLSFFVTSCNASISGVTTEKSRENTSFTAKTLCSASLSF